MENFVIGKLVNFSVCFVTNIMISKPGNFHTQKMPEQSHLWEKKINEQIVKKTWTINLEVQRWFNSGKY